jgi:23S rRNA (cytidine1920-2'-O)/16S rRNA (cytidine1409-2'-O)-methyltransferase
MAKRDRLDKRVVELGLAQTRQRAQALIRAGQVLVNDVPRDKPGMPTPLDASIRIRGERLRYVGRGGLKLEAALDAFEVDPTGRICADLGASTGGFTDCLLQRGAAKVFAVDVGYGQLAWTLRKDERVEVMERVNARHLETLPIPPMLIVGDLSFISLSKILPAIRRIAAPGAQAVLLIKPQFEAGRDGVGKGGVVKDPAVRAATIAAVRAAAESEGATWKGSIRSPIAGAKKGNIEELAHLCLG